jgi:hypothetical protein
MKNITYHIILFLIASVLWSCGEAEQTLFEGPYFVRFSERETFIKENFHDPFNQNFNDPIEIDLHLAAPAQRNTTTIRYEVSGTAVENVDYVIPGGENKRLLIPAGQFSSSIPLRIINNRANDGDKTIIITITEVNNDLEIGFGANGINGRSHTVTITEDDCPVDIRNFEGIWEFNQNNDEFIYQVQIFVDYSRNNRIIMLGYAGLDVEGAFAFANLDMCTRDLFIPEQNLGPFGGNAGRTRSVGTGSFDEQAGTLRFSYSLDVFGNTVRRVSARKLQN